jgi:NADH:ubiquinone oxidoreductase subunit 2 (subunit N)
VVCCNDDDDDVLDGRRTVLRRLLCQVLGAAGVVAAGYLWLAIVAVFFSLIGCFYYLRVVKIMYFDQPTNTAPIVSAAGREDSDVGERPGGGVLGIFPQALMSLCAFCCARSAVASDRNAGQPLP